MNNFSLDLIEYYDEFQNSLFNYAEESEIISNILKENSAKSVADVGCGTGTHLIHLAKKGYQCTGIDLSQEMLKAAEEKADKAGLDIRFKQADARKSLVLEDFQEKFDACIWIRATLSSLEDIQSALETERRILKPSGIMIFDIIHPDGEIYETEILNMDLIGQGHTAVRFNNFNIRYPKVFYQSACFIQTGESIKIIPNNLELIMMELRDVKDILEKAGFKYDSVVYEYTGIPKTKCLFILARRSGP